MGKLILDSPQRVQLAFEGYMGERVRANLDNWLLRAPDANPGMIEMFRLRDRKPKPELVPWAGEFVGKYLISAIQARRMVDSPELDELLKRVIAELISTQADDGYLGPFPKNERLLGHWDLWGHYHVMLALMMWHEDTGDEEALRCAVRAADLICKTYLDGERRVIDAGSWEMNMAVIHALGRLHRKTGNERYLQMMREIEKDWEKTGDYFRTALAGKEFYRTPRPRWESLHDIQGLVELFLITGDERYKTAFAHIWRSINHFDRHNTGAFSTNEQAIGDPFAPGAIETCCTTAWVAMSVDMLRLTGDSIVADELERATWNTVLGSQHPSGRWWTYNTPMDGNRAASAHTIVFQARVGTPELNCCSVNAPRGIGALSEWAVMLDEAGPIVNYYGPVAVKLSLHDGTRLGIRQETDYPRSGRIRISVSTERTTEFDLRLRIPNWSARSALKVNGEELDAPMPGRYCSVRRKWKDGDAVELQLDVSPRIEAGERACAGKASVYWGPALLAFDQHYNSMDTDAVPAIDPRRLRLEPAEAGGRFEPLLLFRTSGVDGVQMKLCDFASAGAYGTHYASWLPAVNAPPGPFHLRTPEDGQRIGHGPFSFTWTVIGRGRGPRYKHELVISKTEDIAAPVLMRNMTANRCVLDVDLPAGDYFWTVTRHNAHGATRNAYGPGRFTVDPTVRNPALDEAVPDEFPEAGPAISSSLDGDARPQVGTLERQTGIEPAEDRNGKAGGAVSLNGETSSVTYCIPYFPEDEYSVTCWVCPEGLPIDRLAQVFSAWAAGMDDPLRVVIQGDRLFARIETGGRSYSTEGIPLKNGEWVHVAAVKKGEKLELYVNGELVTSAQVPAVVYSICEAVGLGTNPRFTGQNERLKGRLDAFEFHVKALTAEEVRAAYGK